MCICVCVFARVSVCACAFVHCVCVCAYTCTVKTRRRTFAHWLVYGKRGPVYAKEAYLEEIMESCEFFIVRLVDFKVLDKGQRVLPPVRVQVFPRKLLRCVVRRVVKWCVVKCIVKASACQRVLPPVFVQVFPRTLLRCVVKRVVKWCVVKKWHRRGRADCPGRVEIRGEVK